MDVFNLAEYTYTPGTGLKEEGPFSAEEFFYTVLKEKIDSALAKKQPLILNIDGTAGIHNSFLEGLAIQLIENYNIDDIINTFGIMSLKNPNYVYEFYDYLFNLLHNVFDLTNCGMSYYNKEERRKSTK